jgi:hypothetical protein
VRPSHRFGRDVLDAFVKTDEHRDAKPYTEGDELASAIYARAAADKFDELMRDQSVQEQVEQSQDAHEQEQQLENARAARSRTSRGEAKAAHDNGERSRCPARRRVKDLTDSASS